MIETDRLLAFLAACSILALTPGPGIFYVMTRTLTGGTREGALSSLGIQMIRRSGHLEVADAPPPKGNPSLQGIITEALNPKTAIFFLSFLHQFVALGGISVTLNTLAAPLARKLTGTWRRRQQLATGAGMVTLGAYVAID